MSIDHRVILLTIGIILGYVLARALFPHPDDAAARPLPNTGEHEQAHDGKTVQFPKAG